MSLYRSYQPRAAGQFRPQSDVQAGDPSSQKRPLVERDPSRFAISRRYRETEAGSPPFLRRTRLLLPVCVRFREREAAAISGDGPTEG